MGLSIHAPSRLCANKGKDLSLRSHGDKAWDLGKYFPPTSRCNWRGGGGGRAMSNAFCWTTSGCMRIGGTKAGFGDRFVFSLSLARSPTGREIHPSSFSDEGALAFLPSIDCIRDTHPIASGAHANRYTTSKRSRSPGGSIDKEPLEEKII